MKKVKTYKGKPVEWRKDESYKPSNESGLVEIWELWAGKIWLGSVRYWNFSSPEHPAGYWDCAGSRYFLTPPGGFTTKLRATNALERALGVKS